MTEVRKVETSMVDQKCPVCSNGWMRPTGIVVPSEPPMFEHKCTSCDYKQSYSVRYPHSV